MKSADSHRWRLRNRVVGVVIAAWLALPAARAALVTSRCKHRRCYVPTVLAGLLISIATFSAAPARAGTFDSLRDAGASRVKYTHTPFVPEIACNALRSRTTYEYSVINAKEVEASGTVPAHCQLHGVIQPEVQFWLFMPAKWNGRFYMLGEGGYAGHKPELPLADRQRASLSFKMWNGLKNGFAVAFTNTGHDADEEPLATFANRNLQKEIDYYFRAAHLTALTAKALVADYYGNPARWSYWDGCSTGGRQGLMEAQRFPADFDGILTGAPVHEFTGLHTWYAWLTQTLAQSPVRRAKVDRIVGPRIYQMCDGLDGVEDGSIEDPLRCRFDPAKDLPRCASDRDADDCLTGKEIGALARIYGGVISNGRKLFPGLPVGAERSGVMPFNDELLDQHGWERFVMNADGTAAAFPIEFGTTFWRYIAAPVDAPDLNLQSIDFDKDVSRFERLREGVLDATVPNLGSFRDRGGKMITYFGWADMGVVAPTAIDYYESAKQVSGDSLADFYRLFLVPGMFHCQGGFGTDTFDAMTPLIDWVEKGIAPDSIPAYKIRKGEVARSRPLCPYPLIARYQGSGSVDEAKSFACAEFPR